MKKIIAVLLIIAICLAVASCMPNLQKYAVRFADEKIDVSLADLRNEEYLAFLNKIEVFSTKLTTEVYSSVGEGRNFCISPVSVYMALALACECSDGETRQEILDAVGVTYEEVSAFSKYLYAFRNREYKYLDEFDKENIAGHENLANSIWINDGSIYDPACVNKLASNYNCDVFSASFRNGTAQKMINQYIEYKSHGVISGGVEFSKETFFSIINVFHMQEVWNSLGKHLTLTLEYYQFENFDGDTTKTQLLKGNYVNGRVYEDEDFSSFFVETAHGYRLHFIVPNESTKLIDVFNQENISKVLSIEDYGYVDEENLQLHHTRVYFPEFTTSYSGNIGSILSEKFEINSLFDAEKCNFSPLIQGSNAYCNGIVHKCLLKVDSHGIEGAAITSISASTSPGPSEYENVYHDFIIDKSFGFVLTDSYGTILFSGVISTLD